MKYILSFLLFFSLSTLSGADFYDINWEDSYKEALAEAKIQNKYVMVLITSKRCKWCKKLKRYTLTNDAVVNRLNDKFISVELTRKRDDYPQKELRARAVPTTYFLDADGNKIMNRPVIGYWNVRNYLSQLDVVDYQIQRKEKKK